MHLSLLPPALAFGCALASLIIGVVLLGTSVRGYHPSHRVFPFFAFSSSLYGAASVAAYVGNTEAWEVGAGRFQAAVAVAFILLVQRYAALDLGPLRRPWLTWSARLPPLVGLFLYEGFGVTGRMKHVWIGWLSYSLPTVEETSIGIWATLLMVAGICVPLVRYWRATVRLLPDALPHAVAFTVLFAGAAGQVCAASGLVPIFDLVPTSCSVALLILARVVSRRWRGDIHSLEDLRDQLEIKVEQRGRELAEAHQALARAERLAAVGRLSAGLAHALNNPGAVVVANLEYLKLATKDGRPPPDTAEVVAESLAAAQRLTRTVRRLMVFSRAAGAEPHAQHISGDGFDLAEAVERAVRPVQALGKGRVKLETQTPAGLRIRGRSALLEQALGEVLQNALAAIPEDQGDGVVSVAAAVSGEKVLLKISDNGVGISREVHESIFEPFSTFRADGGEVGLAIVVGLLRALGGEVRVDSSPGQGSTFTFVLEPG